MRTLPEEVYRYMDEEWVDNFLMNGDLRLSTLKRCQTIECSIRRDENEGKWNYVTKVEGVNKTPARRWLPDFRDKNGEIIEDVTYGIFYYSINNFLFCLSSEHSQKMLNHFETNSCLIIHDLDGFYNEISKALFKEIPLCEDGYGEVLYQEDNPHNIEQIVDAIDLNPISINFTKSTEFKEDKEVRIVWVPYPEEKEIFKKVVKTRKYGYKFQEETILTKCEVDANGTLIKTIEAFEFIDVNCPSAIKYCSKSAIKNKST
jgi:hypothetical protein